MSFEPISAKRFQVSISNGTGILYEFAGDPSLKANWTHNRRLQLVGNSWELAVWPTAEHMSDLRGSVSTAVLLAGLFITAALTFVLYILGQSRFKAQQLADANIELYSEIDERERVEKQMAYLAEHDALTGLINRNALKRILVNGLRRVMLKTTLPCCLSTSTALKK